MDMGGEEAADADDADVELDEELVKVWKLLHNSRSC